MDIANLAQYFNGVAVEAYRKTVEVVMPKGSLGFVVQEQPISDSIEWCWRLTGRIPEDVVTGVIMTVKPDPLGLGAELILTVFAHEGEEKINQLMQTCWARFVRSDNITYDSYKKDLAEAIAFELRLACEYLERIAPRLGEISANKERIRQEMRTLNFILHRAV